MKAGISIIILYFFATSCILYAQEIESKNALFYNKYNIYEDTAHNICKNVRVEYFDQIDSTSVFLIFYKLDSKSIKNSVITINEVSKIDKVKIVPNWVSSDGINFALIFTFKGKLNFNCIDLNFDTKDNSFYAKYYLANDFTTTFNALKKIYYYKRY